MNNHVKRLSRTLEMTSGVALALLGAAACGGSEQAATSDETAQSAQAIINGTEVNPEHSGVVVLEDADGRKYCSGTLLTNRLILTAKHCIISTSGFSAAQPLDTSGGITDNRSHPERIYVRMGAQRIRASTVLVWDHFRPVDLNEDVALIGLETPMTMRANVAPNIGQLNTTGFVRPFYQGTIQQIGGRTLFCMGYGAVARNQTTPLDGKLRRATVTSTYVPEGNGAGQTIRTDVTSAGQLQWHGDSGGPCFTSTAVDAPIVAVTSAGDFCSQNRAWSDAWTDYGPWVQIVMHML